MTFGPDPPGQGADLPLVLASASPRRRKILREAGIAFEAAAPDVAELIIPGDPRGTALANARAKAQWARERFRGRVLLAADTVVSCDGQCLGKPSSMDDARGMLRMLSGREHRVVTAVGLLDPGGALRTEVAETRVSFRRLSDESIAAYFARVDPLDKAGAYDIDQHGDLLIEEIDGSYTNVMGLPIESVRALVRLARIELTTFSSGG